MRTHDKPINGSICHETNIRKCNTNNMIVDMKKALRNHPGMIEENLMDFLAYAKLEKRRRAIS